VDRKPVPQPRPRITRRGPPRAYVPSDHPVHEFRSAIAKAALSAGAFPTTKPVVLSVSFLFARPKSHLRNGVPKDGSPLVPQADVDNLAKSVMDALTAVAYADDKLVMRLTTEKRYATVDRVTVRVHHAE
jgi:crossover junction endodeoxyribonuclease RusA